MSSTVEIVTNHEKHMEEKGYGNFTAFEDVPVKNLGSLYVEFCTDCPYVAVICNCTNNVWNKEETVLICKLCGKDNT